MFQLPIRISTLSHGSECMNMIHVNHPVSEKERDQSETRQPFQSIVFIIALFRVSALK